MNVSFSYLSISIFMYLSMQKIGQRQPLTMNPRSGSLTIRECWKNATIFRAHLQPIRQCATMYEHGSLSLLTWL